jgi:hypothetical protein
MGPGIGAGDRPHRVAVFEPRDMQAARFSSAVVMRFSDGRTPGTSGARPSDSTHCLATAIWLRQGKIGAKSPIGHLILWSGPGWIRTSDQGIMSPLL